jgi:hypothetical protein
MKHEANDEVFGLGVLVDMVVFDVVVEGCWC